MGKSKKGGNSSHHSGDKRKHEPNELEISSDEEISSDSSKEESGGDGDDEGDGGDGGDGGGDSDGDGNGGKGDSDGGSGKGGSDSSKDSGKDAGPSALVAEKVPAEVFTGVDLTGGVPVEADPNGCDHAPVDPNGCGIRGILGSISRIIDLGRRSSVSRGWSRLPDSHGGD
eukprot:XP_020400971.1 uncharacterized protein LOC109942832 [Zea mays]